MQIIFRNSLGEVVFSGKSSNNMFHITQISGLGLTGKTFQTVMYPGLPGQKTISMSDNARTIAITGDIRFADSAALHNTFRVINAPGELFINNTRRINCYCSDLQLGDRTGAYRSFVLQLTCDSPYFTDTTTNTVGLFQTQDQIGLWNANTNTNAFTFPMVFTKRNSGAEITIGGDLPVEPVFSIRSLSVSSDHTKTIHLTNSATGSKITFHYCPVGSEIVTIDIPNRRIYDNSGTNLLQHLDVDCFLGDFILQNGYNMLQCVSDNPDMNVSCNYYNLYLEAVS